MGSSARNAGIGQEQLLPRASSDSGRGIDRARRCMFVAPLVVLLAMPGVAAGGDLRYRDRGRAVASLQQRLIMLGYLEHGEVDGVFGDKTWHAVVALQGWEQIARDGVVGPRTRRALRHARRPQPWRRVRRALEIDQARQVLLVIERGEVRLAVHASTGASKFATPVGRFTVIRRERMSWSLRYHVWLPYALYFHRGWAIHASRIVPDQPASRGCVRIPVEEAPFVFRASPLGTPVLIRGTGRRSRF
jgi:L,D-transpeptidase catalytic domain/Putative peptidoglycan binding domain